jgi:hypothetical protein
MMKHKPKYYVEDTAVLQRSGKSGVVIYDFVDDPVEAAVICELLNEGKGPEWDAICEDVRREVSRRKGPLPQSEGGLKVFLTNMISVREAKPYANGNKQVPVIVAAKSKAAAARALGVTPRFLNTYANIARSATQIAIASNEPGVPFYYDERGDKRWHRWERE